MSETMPCVTCGVWLIYVVSLCAAGPVLVSAKQQQCIHAFTRLSARGGDMDRSLDRVGLCMVLVFYFLVFCICLLYIPLFI